MCYLLAQIPSFIQPSLNEETSALELSAQLFTESVTNLFQGMSFTIMPVIMHIMNAPAVLGTFPAVLKQAQPVVGKAIPKSISKLKITGQSLCHPPYLRV